jgi:hypothetical protein
MLTQVAGRHTLRDEDAACRPRAGPEEPMANNIVTRIGFLLLTVSCAYGQQSLPSEAHVQERQAITAAKESSEDVIVVPAGAELRVDVDQHKMVLPVRVGFDTAIPALSEVTVQTDRTYINTPVSYSGASVTSYVDYVDYATVTAVTVSGKTYELQTNQVALAKGGTNNEVIFVMSKAVTISR